MDRPLRVAVRCAAHQRARRQWYGRAPPQRCRQGRLVQEQRLHTPTPGQTSLFADFRDYSLPHANQLWTHKHWISIDIIEFRMRRPLWRRYWRIWHHSWFAGAAKVTEEGPAMGVFACDESGATLPDYNGITRHGLQVLVGLNTVVYCNLASWTEICYILGFLELNADRLSDSLLGLEQAQHVLMTARTKHRGVPLTPLLLVIDLYFGYQTGRLVSVHFDLFSSHLVSDAMRFFRKTNRDRPRAVERTQLLTERQGTLRPTGETALQAVGASGRGAQDDTLRRNCGRLSLRRRPAIFLPLP